MSVEPTPTGLTATRVTSEDLGDGTTKTTKEQTVTDPATGSKLKSTTTSYTVKSMEPGKSVTLVAPDGSVATYALTPQASVPADVVVGRKVTIESVPGAPAPQIQTIRSYGETTTTAPAP